MAYYHYKTGFIVPYVEKFYKQIAVVFVSLVLATMAVSSLNANAATVNGCTFTETPGIWTLDADCSSTAQINIPAATTLDGGGFTITSAFAKTDNSNNSALGVLNDDVTIQNLTIDGTGGTNLHGINVYDSTNIVIDNVTVRDMNRSGIVVNSSEVTVGNVTTGNNGWSGINVDYVVGSAELNIVGPMIQTDLAQIYVDDTTEDVNVNDTLSQYNFVDNPLDPAPINNNDRLYTLKVVLASKDACKKDGWKLSELPVFKNQGQCVAYFASNGANVH